MQKIDLIVDGVLKLKGQKSDSAVVQKRITAAYQRPGSRIQVLPSAVTPPPPPPPPHPNSIWYGRGAFTTALPASAAGLHCDWTAMQADPEGDTSGSVPGITAWWMARPTAAKMTQANKNGIPFIAQSENLPEFKLCLDLFDQAPLDVPHALVGKVDRDWPSDLRAKAVAQGWELLLEWYWNNQPDYTEPNADNYPLFRNVVFGTFDSETVPGRRVFVDQYRDVWHGSFSCWDTEGMVVRDRAAFNA